MEQHVFDMVHDDAVCTNGTSFTFHRFPDMSYGLLELSTPDPMTLRTSMLRPTLIC